MSYTMSPNIAIYVEDLQQAKQYYIDFLNFELVSETSQQLEIKADLNTFFIMKDDQFTGAVHELFVDDLETAKNELLSHGCEIVRWHGKGKDCYVRDPFGVLFNIWEL